MSADATVTYKGRRLIRRTTEDGATLWQSEESSRDWGLWYASRREAYQKSNASDRVVRAVSP